MAASTAASVLASEKLHLSPGMSQLLAINNRKKEEGNEKRRQEEDEEAQRRRADAASPQPLSLRDLEPHLLQLQHDRQSQSEELGEAEGEDAYPAQQQRSDARSQAIHRLTQGPAHASEQRAGGGGDYALPVMVSGVLLLGFSAWAGWRWIVHQQRRLKR